MVALIETAGEKKPLIIKGLYKYLAEEVTAIVLFADSARCHQSPATSPAQQRLNLFSYLAIASVNT